VCCSISQNGLLLASLSLAGMMVAFPTAAGVSAVVAAVISFATYHDRPPGFLISVAICCCWQRL
jgi:hypothetical protein